MYPVVIVPPKQLTKYDWIGAKTHPCTRKAHEHLSPRLSQAIISACSYRNFWYEEGRYTELWPTEDVSYLDVTKCHGLYRMSGRDSNVTLYSIQLLYKRSHSHYMYNIVVKTSMRALTEEKSCIQYLQIYTNFSSALLEVSGCKNNNKPCSFIENNITKTDPLC